jgi:hypothetical protein
MQKPEHIYKIAEKHYSSDLMIAIVSVLAKSELALQEWVQT